jgi:hypothetical protein
VASTELNRNLTKLESDLKRLEAEYNMFFAGRVPKPPLETRSRVAALIKQYDRAHISNYGDRFRFTTLQSRYSALVELWDRGLRAREEGRTGPFAQTRPQQAEAQRKASGSRVLHVAAFSDPSSEGEKLRDLYNSLADARREVGAEPVPFDRFADLVRTQFSKLQADGQGASVAFRVAMEDGKVQVTARALHGMKGAPDEE